MSRGFSLVESMVALLIFAAGVLGIARLQSAAVQQTSTSAFRTTASLLAKNLVSRMWLADRTPATLQANFQNSPAGAGYTAWMATVTASGLPAARATVAIDSPLGPGTAPRVTIQVFWKAPGDSAEHIYTEVTQIK